MRLLRELLAFVVSTIGCGLFLAGAWLIVLANRIGEPMPTSGEVLAKPRRRASL
jgi:hypothetical protein